MPAYRSEAEAEVRAAVVDRLRKLRPDARIMHEVNASSFGNRIDVLAVSRAEIIAVEIKSAKDKLDRLADQLAAMKGCAHHAIAALHEKFLVEEPCGSHSAHRGSDGLFYMSKLPPAASRGETCWVYPERRRAMEGARYDVLERWYSPKPAVQDPLPGKAIDMLWRDELLWICQRYAVQVPKRPTMGQMVPALRWQLSGRDLTLAICAVLRARRCVEADTPLAWEESAKAA